MDHHAGAVDVRHPQIGAFLQAPSARVNQREADSITPPADAAKKLSHFGDGEDDRQLLLRRGPHDPKDGPATVERVLVEKAEAADGDGHGVAGVVLDTLEVEEVLTKFFLRD